MAVKIVKYGSKRIVTCPTCGCLLEFEVEDVRAKQTGMNEYDYVIRCLNCKEEVSVPYQCAR